MPPVPNDNPTPQPGATPETFPPPPVLIGDPAAELLREAGFPPEFRRNALIGVISAFAVGVPVALVALSSVYYVATKTTPHDALDYEMPLAMIVIAALLLTGGFLLLRPLAGCRAMYAAARGQGL